jgi:hypothetical protein
MTDYYKIETPEEFVYVNTTPDTCPFCRSLVYFEPVKVFYIDEADIQLVLKCPKNGCHKYTIGLYRCSGQVEVGFVQDPHTYNAYSLYDTVPETPLSLQKETFPNEITEVSPQFEIIFNQAYAAEQMKLSEIAGVGYRKALEFLVKDFAIHRNPAQKDKILNTLLASCLKTYIEDPKIRSVAERAIWLGNDETHYLRKWEDKDINDLKVLIQLTVAWIKIFQLTEKYTNEMPKAG